MTEKLLTGTLSLNTNKIIVDGFVIAAAAFLTKAGTRQKPGPQSGT